MCWKHLRQNAQTAQVAETHLRQNAQTAQVAKQIFGAERRQWRRKKEGPIHVELCESVRSNTGKYFLTKGIDQQNQGGNLNRKR